MKRHVSKWADGTNAMLVLALISLAICGICCMYFSTPQNQRVFVLAFLFLFFIGSILSEDDFWIASMYTYAAILGILNSVKLPTLL